MDVKWHPFNIWYHVFRDLSQRQIDFNIDQSHFGTYTRCMRIIAVNCLRSFWEKHLDAEQHLKSWIDEVKKATWSQPADIKRQYRNASILKNRRVVFNIKGNDYRLVVSVAYRYQAVYIKFIGTHIEYDAIAAETVEMEH